MRVPEFRKSYRLQTPSTGFLPFLLEAGRTEKKIIDQNQALAAGLLPAFPADAKPLVGIDCMSAGKYDGLEIIYHQ